MLHLIISSTFKVVRQGHGSQPRGSRIEVMLWDHCGVGYVERSILRDIVHSIRVVGHRSIMHRRRKLLGMLGRVFLVSMQHWITSKWITNQFLLRCTISL